MFRIARAYIYRFSRKENIPFKLFKEKILQIPKKRKNYEPSAFIPAE